LPGKHKLKIVCSVTKNVLPSLVWAEYVLIAKNFLKQVFRYSQFDMAGNKNVVEENVKFGPLLLESASLGNLYDLKKKVNEEG
jgi:hypothetical protein